MVITFFDYRSMVYINRVPQGQTVNAAYYITVLKQLTRSCQELKLHQDNALPFVGNTLIEFLVNKDIKSVPPYSTDLALNDFFYTLRPKKSWDDAETMTR